LPQKIKRFTVLRSSFKFKNAREQFERKTYTRLIDVVENGPKTIEYLQNLPVPVGVMVFVKVF
jgi:small subunit ribosomal protein S10